MNKSYARFITALFLVFLAGFLIANAATPDRAFSPLENRALAQAPVMTLGRQSNVLSGAFMEEFETYVTDQFVLRDQWIALKARAEVCLGKRENNGVYLCDAETLIARFDPPATERAEARIESNFGYVDTLATLTDKPVYFSLIPGKVSVWAERLPEGAPNDDEGAYLARGSRLEHVRWLDVATALHAHSDEAIYYRTDHHWSTLGAYYGYAALAEGMGLSPVALSELTPTVESESFYGTTFSSSGVRWMPADCIETYVPDTAGEVVNDFGQGPEAGVLYDRSKLAEKDKYAMFLGGNKPLTVLTSHVAPAGAPKLLVVRDSFADSLAPFLLYHFSEVHLVDPRYYKTSMAGYLRDHELDAALVLYSVGNFVTDASLFTLGLPAN